MAKTVGYVRVSSKDQNLDRQLLEMKSLGIEDKHIYQDKQSGKDFDRLGYQYMKRTLEPGDTLVIKSLDRLGRNQSGIKEEWQWFRDTKINVRVLDMPALNIEYTSKEMEGLYSMISNIVFEVMSWKAEEERKSIKQRQSEGIAAAKGKGKHLGRPNAVQPQNFLEVYLKWRLAKEITAVQAMHLLNLKKSTFYNLVKHHEAKNGSLA